MTVEIDVEGNGQTLSVSWEVDANMLFMLMEAAASRKLITIKQSSARGPVTTETTISGVVLSVRPQKPCSVTIRIPSLEVSP